MGVSVRAVELRNRKSVARAMLAALISLTSVASILDPSAGTNILSGLVHRESDFAPPRLVNDLRTDVAALADAGFFNSAGSGGRAGSEDTMRSALYCDPISRDRSIGDWFAFEALFERLDLVRQELEQAIGIELLPEFEIHYVHYDQSGYYQKHTDDSIELLDDRNSRRCVSFILYLTPPEAPWPEDGGGELRAYVEDGGHKDFLPLSGSLVLFDSCTVEHEVMPTNRKRTCLIGWFHTPAGNVIA